MNIKLDGLVKIHRDSNHKTAFRGRKPVSFPTVLFWRSAAFECDSDTLREFTTHEYFFIYFSWFYTHTHTRAKLILSFSVAGSCGAYASPMTEWGGVMILILPRKEISLKCHTCEVIADAREHTQTQTDRHRHTHTHACTHTRTHTHTYILMTDNLDVA